MQLAGEPDLGHLTYCTNIHAGTTWQEVLDSLRQHLPTIRSKVCPDSSFGVGLRLSALATATLLETKHRAELIEFLTAGDYYVFTINGFPYGPFHGEQVKSGAYRPDWATPQRLEYTNQLADLLAELVPAGLGGSISTVPGTFKPWAERRIDRITGNLIEHVAHLHSIAERSGRQIVLALEPEPCCLLETIEETIAFFEQKLLSSSARAHLARRIGADVATADQVLRDHIGVCYDVCHAAVEYEDPTKSVEALRAAGIAIAKLQLSSALRIPKVDANALERLKQFDEPVYLHQVVERRNSTLYRYADLSEAFAATRSKDETSEWRVHFHVPIFLEDLPGLGTTQRFLREILDLHSRQPLSRHLEVETYTWDVLPSEYRDVTVAAAIAREINWVRSILIN